MTAAALSDRSRRELTRTFLLIDKNKDGRICANDMKKAMSMLGHAVGDQQIQGFIRRAANGGCDLREEEFVGWMEATLQGSSNGIVQQAFSALDTNDDGFISKDELRDGLATIGETVSESMLDIMMEDADRDRDNRLSFEEFQQAIELHL